MSPEQTLDLFRAAGALHEGHFELSSGRHSDQFFQCALVLADPVRAEQLAQALAQKIDVQVDLVVGPALHVDRQDAAAAALLELVERPLEVRSQLR